MIVTLEDLYEIFNKTDANTVTCHSITIPEVKEKAETVHVVNKMFDRFQVNEMKVNDDKFQYTSIVFCRNKPSDEYVSVGSNKIMSSSCAKLLGVYLIRN